MRKLLFLFPSRVQVSLRWSSSRNYMESATNLINYLALKCLDTEPLKDVLALISLLNLKMVNSSVLASLTTCIQLLENLQLKSVRTDENVSDGICTQEKLYQQKNGNFATNTMTMKACSNRDLLLGPLQGSRLTQMSLCGRIIVILKHWQRG